MTSSTNFSSKVRLLILAALLVIPACAMDRGVGIKKTTVKSPLVAVLPLHSLAGSAVPLIPVRQELIGKLESQGIRLLPEEALESFMAKHRVRYVGGIDREVARAFKSDTGAEAVLITSLEHFDRTYPPKIAVTSRLVSAGENPTILWIDSVTLAGDESPGFLDLGLIEDPAELQSKALTLLSQSLTDYLSGSYTPAPGRGWGGKLKPKRYYGKLEDGREKKPVVAVAPFFSVAGRRHAGDVLALHFVEQLWKLGRFDVMEPGLVRQSFLNLRLILAEGVSVPNAEALFSTLDIDLIVSGKALDYEDYIGSSGTPKVNFSTVIFDRRGPVLTWSSISYNRGDDGVFFFDRGMIYTSHGLASGMTRYALDVFIGT